MPQSHTMEDPSRRVLHALKEVLRRRTKLDFAVEPLEPGSVGVTLRVDGKEFVRSPDDLEEFVDFLGYRILPKTFLSTELVWKVDKVQIRKMIFAFFETEITQATEKDLAEIKQVIHSVSDCYYPPLLSRGSRFVMEKMVLMPIEKNGVWLVARHQPTGEIVGVLSRFVNDAQSFRNFLRTFGLSPRKEEEGKDVGELHMLVVDPNSSLRRTGIGARLTVRHMESFAKQGIETVTAKTYLNRDRTGYSLHGEPISRTLAGKLRMQRIGIAEFLQGRNKQGKLVPVIEHSKSSPVDRVWWRMCTSRFLRFVHNSALENNRKLLDLHCSEKQEQTER